VTAIPTPPHPSEHAAPGAGIGLRLPHVLEVAATRPAVAWFEIHPENFLANPHAREVLQDIARVYPIAVHTVGVSVGSTHGVDRSHLARIGSLVHALDPIMVSGHLAWSTHDGEYLNDLLPLPYTEETIALVRAHVLEVQDALGRPFVLENPASYVGFATSTMHEPAFLNRLADETGCRLLCDVSNIVLSGANLGYSPEQYVAELDPRHVAEYHLGGFEREHDDANGGESILIDTHGCRIAESSWALLRHVLDRVGARPTLIEWDNEIPPLETLLEEAAKASACLDASRVAAHAHR
jgi:uncharacterized protein (UPF0276 family)